VKKKNTKAELAELALYARGMRQQRRVVESRRAKAEEQRWWSAAKKGAKAKEQRKPPEPLPKVTSRELAIAKKRALDADNRLRAAADDLACRRRIMAEAQAAYFQADCIHTDALLLHDRASRELLHLTYRGES
jgi:hypothetical protein